MVTPSPPRLICVSAAHVSEATSLAYHSSVNQLPVLDPLPSQDSAALSAQVFYTSVPLFPKHVPFIYTYSTAQDNGLDSNSCRVYSAAAIRWKLLLKDAETETKNGIGKVSVSQYWVENFSFSS